VSAARLVASLLVVLALLLPVRAFADEPADVKTVVALFHDERLFPLNVTYDATFRTTFAARTAGRIEYFTEFIDYSRFLGQRYEADVRDALRAKYRSVRVDLLLVSSLLVLKLLEQEPDSLFPGVPVVLYQTPKEELPPTLPRRKVTGVLLDGEARLTGTVDLALHLQPETEHIAFVSGDAPVERALTNKARQILSPYAARYDVRYLTGRSLATLEGELSRLPVHSVVFYMGMRKDATGKTFIPRDLVGPLSESSAAPIYGPLDVYLGHGIVGGTFSGTEETGKRVTDLALRILDGEDVDRIPMENEAVVPTVDVRQLDRWGIARERIPRGALLRFDEPSVFRRYQWQILGAAALCAGQTALVMALVAQLRRRRAMEITLLRAREEVTHIARVATMGELTAALAHEVNQPLGAIMSNAEAAQMLLATERPDLDEVRIILADIRAENRRAADVLTRMRVLFRKGELALAPLDLGELVLGVARLCEALARSRKIKLSTDIAPELPKVLGDRVHLTQVLLNLVINGMDAMSATAPPTRHLAICAARAKDDGAEVAVSDRGIGISQDQVTRLFEPFYTTKRDGMGMGLPIVRTIVEAHGGAISVESAPGCGTTMRFTVRAAP
jgi:signal transduction histidine kinase